ncbi:AsmA-like C-terminal region-containing protein [Planctobacterium marinum]|uniref:AsmA domain-containing protein n=1 Tax=Planctobacterium marinum TaxID=1631968 RepID=A0AA48I138_9ALTE|nr:hypothetical protein MACH26_38260 [Planctobacterium marinum]
MIARKNILIGLISIPLLLILVTVLAWDANWFKGQATPFLEDIESHSISFNDIEHSLLTPGKIKLNDITLAGPVAKGDIGTLIADVNVLDAFSKNIVVNEIRLLAPRIDIDMQALNDWLAIQTEKPAAEPHGKPGALPVNRIVVKKISIENANFRDTSALQQFLLDNLTLTLKNLNIAENAEIIILQDHAPITASLSIEDITAQGANLGKLSSNITATEKTINIQHFQLASQSSQLALSGTIKNPKEQADIQLGIADSKLNLADFAPLAPELPIPLQGLLSLMGNINAQGELANPQSLISNLSSELKISLDTAKSLLDIESVINSEQGEQAIKLQINDSQISMDEFQGLLKDSPVLPSGNVKLSGLLDARGILENPNSLLQTLSGNLALGLENGKLTGIDINKIVKGFKDSKESDWKDVGSFLVTGPIGILAANIFDLGSGAATSGGETLIPQLRVNGAMDNGAILFKDTALATDKYRLAFDGQVNPAQKTFKNFTFALLDKAGCADIKQTLNGAMSNPSSAIAQSLLDSAIAPISGLLKTLKNSASQCTPFYQGEVVHPGN